MQFIKNFKLLILILPLLSFYHVCTMSNNKYTDDIDSDKDIMYGDSSDSEDEEIIDIFAEKVSPSSQEVRNKSFTKELLKAIIEDKIDEVKRLIPHNGPIKFEDSLWTSPMHCAVFYQKPRIVQYLITKEQPTDLKDKGGKNPLTMAALQKSGEIFRLLFTLTHFETLDSSAMDYALQNFPVNISNSSNMTLYHLAALTNNTQAVIQLLKKGGCSDLVDKFGRTPLSIALLNDNQNLIRLLSGPQNYVPFDPTTINFALKNLKK